MRIKHFELLPHTADLKMRVYGKTVQELFAYACIGMFTVIGPQSKLCVKKNDELVCSEFSGHHDVSITAVDKEMLLVDFLSEVLYLSDVHNEAYLAVDMHDFAETSLRATVHAVKISRFDVEIKAVTYHDLSFIKTPDGWQVDIVFDI